MPTTPKGVFYPDGTWTFPPGFSGEGGAFETMAESVDAALTNRTVDLIGTYTNASVTNMAQFSDIPATYENLILMWEGRIENQASSYASLLMRFNGDGGTNYWASRFAIVSDSTPAFANGSAYANVSGLTPGLVGPQASSGIVYIGRYTRAISKSAWGHGIARIGTGQSAANHRLHQGLGVWNNTATITSVRFWPSGEDWAAGLRATLLGTPRVN
ncbi:hypothetical protein [Stackebrandtia soli]|uniref:hypothetical protein n=1 Tax=Stackebrandtia soli TaxID=1892856 RepID=UPI0039ECE253